MDTLYFDNTFNMWRSRNKNIKQFMFSTKPEVEMAEEIANSIKPFNIEKFHVELKNHFLPEQHPKEL